MTRQALACALAVGFVLGGCGDDSGSTDQGEGSTSSADSSSTGTSSASTSSGTGTSTSTTATTGTESSGDGSTGEASSGDGSSDDGSSDDASSGDGSTADSSSGDGSTGESGAACAPLPFELIAGDAFAGDGFCEGVPQNVVLDDQLDVDAHVDGYCNSLAMCMDPDPPCPPIPELPEQGTRIVYAFGDSSGCSGAASIEQILDCGDTVEVHYTVAGIGPCAAIVNAWVSAAIPGSATRVVFVPS